MPRSARQISNTKVYHIILRGNDKQDIFYDEQDYKKFIKEIQETKEKYQYKLYAYCLMSNHTHLVIYDKEEQVSKAIQSLAIAYSSYFAKKYEKVGHLFQNRFLSKNVETREYLINVCKYVHRNPVGAGISKLDSYKWSSYRDFITNNCEIVDIKPILSLFDKNQKDAIKKFISFHSDEKEGLNDDIEFEMIENLSDEKVKEKILKLLEINNIRELRTYSKEIRNEKIKILKIIKGTTKTQLARVLGMNRKIVERAMK